jgi:hypothetical protein
MKAGTLLPLRSGKAAFNTRPLDDRGGVSTLCAPISIGEAIDRIREAGVSAIEVVPVKSVAYRYQTLPMASYPRLGDGKRPEVV